MKTKDCRIVFCDKKTYDFSSEDLLKAIQWGEGKKIFAIETPWGVLQPVDRDYYENVRDAVLGGPELDGYKYAEGSKDYAA